MDIPLSDTRTLAVTRVVVELEQHVAAAGWDAPIRIFALVRTASALERDATLTERLPADVIAAAQADPDHLTAGSSWGANQARHERHRSLRSRW